MARLPEIRPKFHNPPLAEQAVTVCFDAIQGFDICDFGLFWGSIRDKFPKSETAPRLETAVEQFGEGIRFETGISFAPIMLPRAFYRSAEGDLVQLQNDRLTFNWVKADGRTYPHFDETLSRFLDIYEKFLAHVRERGLPAPQLRQAELTNVNVIEIRDFDDDFANIGKIFQVDPLDMKSDFLLNETFIRTRQHRIIDSDRQPIGRLHSVISPVFNPFESKKAFKFELTARSAPELQKMNDVKGFFEDARSAINVAFLATVQPEMRNRWGENDG